MKREWLIITGETRDLQVSGGITKSQDLYVHEQHVFM